MKGEEDKRMTERGRIEIRTFHSIDPPIIIIAPWNHGRFSSQGSLQCTILRK